jgi:SET domain-containing protein
MVTKMLLVGHCVKPSPIHGLGVFLLEPVPSGTVVWRYDPMFDIEIPADSVARLPKEEAETVYHHAEYLPDRRIFRLGNDADIFMNHSKGPSLVDQGDEMIASKDLKVGDELTCDYREVKVIGFTSEI